MKFSTVKLKKISYWSNDYYYFFFDLYPHPSIPSSSCIDQTILSTVLATYTLVLIFPAQYFHPKQSPSLTCMFLKYFQAWIWGVGVGVMWGRWTSIFLPSYSWKPLDHINYRAFLGHGQKFCVHKMLSRPPLPVPKALYLPPIFSY